MSDPLAALEADLDRLIAALPEQREPWAHGAAEVIDKIRAAIAKTREALGEVEVREEWGVRFSQHPDAVRHDPGDIPYTEAEARSDAARNGLPLVHRTITTTKHVAPWTPVEEA